MNIKIRKEGVGECNMHSVADIPEEYQYAIKGLAGLQLMFMTNNKEYREPLKEILFELAQLIDKIDNKDNIQDDPVSRFFE